MHWSPALAWLILAIFIIAFVTVFDVHAFMTHGRSMTGQFQQWLANEVIGPILIGAWAGLFIGLTYHFFIRKVN